MDSVFGNDLLVETILSFLPGKDLTNCMQVCRGWNNNIRKIRESRVCCPLILIAFPGHQQKGLACFDDDWPYWNYWIELQRKGNPNESKRITLRTIKKDRPDIVDYVKKIHLPNHFHQFAMNRLSNVPICSIVFSTWAAFNELFSGLVLPTKSTTIIAEDFSSVLFSPSYKSKNIEITWEVDRAFGVSGCFFSDYYSDCEINLHDLSVQHLNRMMESTRPLKSILFFTNLRYKRVFDVCKLSSIDSSVAIAGGSFRSLSYYKSGKSREKQEAWILALTFRGGIEAGSIALELTNSSDITKKLFEFKKTLTFDPDQFDRCGHTVGFIFYTFYKTRRESLSHILDICFPNVIFSGSSVHDIISRESKLSETDSGNNQKKMSDNSQFIIMLIHLKRSSFQ